LTGGVARFLSETISRPESGSTTGGEGLSVQRDGVDATRVRSDTVAKQHLIQGQNTAAAVTLPVDEDFWSA